MGARSRPAAKGTAANSGRAKLEVFVDPKDPRTVVAKRSVVFDQAPHPRRQVRPVAAFKSNASTRSCIDRFADQRWQMKRAALALTAFLAACGAQDRTHRKAEARLPKRWSDRSKTEQTADRLPRP